MKNQKKIEKTEEKHAKPWTLTVALRPSGVLLVKTVPWFGSYRRVSILVYCGCVLVVNWLFFGCVLFVVLFVYCSCIVRDLFVCLVFFCSYIVFCLNIL